MGKYIDWYLVELENRIGSSIPVSKRDEILAEVRLHLESSASEFVTDKRSNDEAEKASIERFGNVRQVGSALLNANDPQPRNQWPVVWAAAATAWPASLLVCAAGDIGMSLLQYGVLVLLIGLSIASYRSRKPRPWAMAGVAMGGGALNLLLVSVFWLDLYSAGGMGILPRWQESYARTSMSGKADRLSVEIKELEKGIAAFGSTGNSVEQDAFKVLGGWRVPVDGYGSVPLREVRFGTAAKLPAAQETWRSMGRRTLSAARSSLEDLRSESDSIELAKGIPFWRSAARQLPEMTAASLSWCLVLLSLNTLFAWSGAYASRRFRRRYTVAGN